MRILAIESSCDDTSVSVLDSDKVKSCLISSQKFHGKYGGIIPELASRAHIKLISALTAEALKQSELNIEDIDAFAVTTEPGLVGSLIVGSNFAKGLAIRYNKPIIPVNHIEGHLYSGCLQDSSITFPFVTLVVSGGHTVIFNVKSYNEYDIVGMTRDDAAGEAFDKIAKLMGLTYPGGPLIDKLSKQGNDKTYDFPRSMIHSDDFDFSFSGLKTSVRYFVQKTFPDGVPEDKMPDLAASVQSAIVDVLVHKTLAAAKKFKAKTIVIAGGVSANSQLRSQMTEEAAKFNIKTVAPDMLYCMDNAAMIGFIAQKKYEENGSSGFDDLDFIVNPTALRAKTKKTKNK
jgi:N6-L-threonylcarbamoyladenine synthase